MAALNKAWGTADRISPTSERVVTGEETKSAGESERAIADQPMLIYVTDGASGAFDKIEKVILMDNKVCLGMWAFRCIKMTPDAVKEDPLLADEMKEDQGFIFVSRDYKKVKALEGNQLSSKKVYAAMKSFAKAAYKTNFDKNIRGMLKVLVEWDKINNQRRVLQEKEKRKGADMSDSEKKKLAKEMKELEEEQKKADEKKAELLKFEPKAIKA